MEIFRSSIEVEAFDTFDSREVWLTFFDEEGWERRRVSWGSDAFQQPDFDVRRDLPQDRSSAVLVTSIIQLAQNLGLDPLAEGIETEEQRAFFLEHDCELGQGFHFSRPVVAAELAA